MRFLRIIGIGVAIGLMVRWAIKAGSVPPEEERHLLFGVDEDGTPIYEDEDCDIDKTIGLWKEMHVRAGNPLPY